MRRLSPLTWFAVVMGITSLIGLPALLFIDMLANRGDVAAKSVHHAIPQCSTSCHQ